MQNNEPSILAPRNPGDWLAWAADLAKAGAQLGNCGRMCKTCAFRFPQALTEDYLLAVEDAIHQLAYEGGFHCHTEDKKDAGTDCIGFKYAAQYLKHKSP